jgi:hypothetical protein
LFSSLANPTELRVGYWHIPTMTAIASLLALAIAAVLVPFSVETKVFTILTLAFAVLFVGLFLPSMTHSWLLAARMGIAGAVALWLVVWLLFVRRAGWPQPLAARQAATAPVAPGAEAGHSTDRPPASEAPPDEQGLIDEDIGGDEIGETDFPGHTATSDDVEKPEKPEDSTGKPERGSDEQ